MPLPLLLTAISPTITASIAGQVVSFLGKIGIKGKTPQLSWDQRNSIAVQAINEIDRQLRDAKYYDDPQFKTILTDRQIAFVNSSNPGNAGDRKRIVGILNANRGTGGSNWEALMFSLQGVSTSPTDPTGAAWRVKDFIDRCVNPAIQEYLKAKGVDPEKANAVTVGGGSQLPSTKPTISPSLASAGGGLAVLLLGGAALYLFFGRGRS